MSAVADAGPVALAEGLWWVGAGSDGELGGSNAYLLLADDQAVLIDPGSIRTIAATLSKVEQLIPLDALRWIVCQHQDPAITSALPQLDTLIDPGGVSIVTHQQAARSIAQYQLRMPFWLVERNRWQLALPQRLLQFIFTPYAHYPGAFCTFDAVSGTLFSGDLFACDAIGAPLFAEGEDHFERIRIHHEHYFPSREVLNQTLKRIENHPLEMIAPQRGPLVPGRLIANLVRELKGIECGLYLMAERDGDIQRLSHLNGILRDITSTMVISRDFREIADRLLAILKRAMPAVSLEFFVQLQDDTVLQLAPESRYRGVAAAPPREVSRLFGISRQACVAGSGSVSGPIVVKADGEGACRFMLPLFREADEWVYGVVVIGVSESTEPDSQARQVMEQMSEVLQVAVEREAIYRGIELERQKFYERSIRDPLTGLFTRFYMEDTLRRLFEIHDRSGGTPVALAMLDIDHFKGINDRYGHVRGDEVLCRVARQIQDDARAGDLAVRLGGEEFGLIVVGDPATEIAAIGERLRQQVAAVRFKGTFSGLRVTISIGTALRQVGESIPGFIERADLALYRAKNLGRNRVCSADTVASPGQWSLDFN
ncbi:MAG: diguanylate cyclase [Gammaproteobacteria bacterium]|nr:diguanylate cyclase [Gammaproteobacteria bacterium]